MIETRLAAEPVRRANGAGLRTLARLLLRPDFRSDWLQERRRRRGGVPPLPAGPIRRVLVLCKGNLCRSPYAEHRLAHALPECEVRSGGLHAAEAESAAEGALRVAPRFGIELGAHRTHRVGADDLGRADLVLVMQGWQRSEVLRRWPDAGPRVRLLGDYAAEPPHAIADPWGEDDAAFERAFRHIDRAAAGLADAIRAVAS